MLYLSGQLGTDSTGRLVPGGIGPETAQALAEHSRAARGPGSGMDRVVKCTAMLADMAEWGAMNQEYVRHFPVAAPGPERLRHQRAGPRRAGGARVPGRWRAAAERAAPVPCVPRTA